MRPTVWTYNTVMSQLARRGMLEAALDLRDDMLKARLQPDVVTSNIILDGLLSAEPPGVQKAESIFMEMLERGPQPDQYTFSILLKAYKPDLAPRASEAAAGASASSALETGSLRGLERLLEVMCEPDRDVSLDTAAVNTLLQAFLRAGTVRKALDLFEAFKTGQCPTAVISWTEWGPGNSLLHERQ